MSDDVSGDNKVRPEITKFALDNRILPISTTSSSIKDFLRIDFRFVVM